MLNGLDLFSGIGGVSTALRPWVRTIAYCERESYAQAVLLSRMRAGDLDEAPIWDDVQTLSADHLPCVDIISGGFPCQDISVAGAGAGLEGERSGLVFELLRLVGECRPRFIFLENVPALAVRGLDRLLLELHALGFDARWTIVSAAEVGAPHLRERIWILAHSDGGGLRLKQPRNQRGQGSEQRLASADGSARRLAGISDRADVGEERGVRAGEASDPSRIRQEMADTSGIRWGQGGAKSIAGRQSFPCISCGRVAHAASPRCEGWVDAKTAWTALPIGGGGGGGEWPSWLPQPAIRRGADGLSHRVDRLRGLGNAVVPQAAREAFRRLAGINHGEGVV